MNSVLLEHAARVLDHQPTRSMDAESLYARAAREAGAIMPFARFLETLRSQPERFAVIPADPVLGDASRWDPRHHALYRAAVAAAGLAAPLVVLVESAARDAAEDPAGTDACSAAGVLRDVHGSLVHLLRCTDEDDPLRVALAASLEELRRTQRML